MSIQVWEDFLSEYQNNAFHPMHSTLNELGVSRKQATLQISDGLKFMFMHLPHEYGNKLERPTCFGCVWVFILLKVKPLNLLFGGQEFLFGYVSEFDI